MYLDACAIVALLADEPEAARISAALASAKSPITSPIAVLETALALSRPDKFNVSIEKLEPVILEFLDDQGINMCDMPPASEMTRLAMDAAHRFRGGKHGLNLGDYLHYACAQYYRVPILATADEYKNTDLDVVA
jgi:ribonuclease VapC